jgi:hypothetical protein
MPLGEDDYAFAVAVLAGLTRFLSKRRQLFERAPKTQVSESITIGELPGRPEVTLTAPHPEATWDWGEDAADALRADAAHDLLHGFLDAAEAQGRSPEWLDAAGESVDQLLSYKVRHAAEPPLGWKPRHIDEYLLDHFPRRGNAPEGQLDSVPDHLDAFFAWLLETGREEREAVGRVRDRIARRRHVFLREASDPRASGSRRRSRSRCRRPASTRWTRRRSIGSCGTSTGV